MTKFFSIGEAAKAVKMTSETLRHYDRIGLVRPSWKSDLTNYRYYTQQDLIKLNTVHMLQVMDLSLNEIKEILEYNNLERIISFLYEADKKADAKIAALKKSKCQIKRAIKDYESKLEQSKMHSETMTIKEIPERVILLSNRMEDPSLEHLFNYWGHFYDELPEAEKKEFLFEDAAGIYQSNGCKRLFAICREYSNTENLKVLPSGRYLCFPCQENERETAENELLKKYRNDYGKDPDFIINMIIVTGIMNWSYEIQLPCPNNSE